MTGLRSAAGLLKPDAHTGSATLVNPLLPGGAEVKNLAVTLEPKGGLHQAHGFRRLSPKSAGIWREAVV